MVDKDTMYKLLSNGKTDELKAVIQGLLEDGRKPEHILKEGLIPAMDEIGVQFKNGEIYVPEVLIAARSMHAGLSVLKPILSKSSANKAAKVIIGTVKGDLHDIGKNLVAMMFEGGGFEVVDLGIDVAAHQFVEAIKKHQPQVVAMSALLTTTMKEMKVSINAIKEAGFQKQVTIVGGAPLSEKFAKEIGADGFAPDAASAVTVVRSLLNNKKI
jgi:5-methyltetrahydrofolate--homocysteine methyltransferase